jgi:putative two-component system response regulator
MRRQARQGPSDNLTRATRLTFSRGSRLGPAGELIAVVQRLSLARSVPEIQDIVRRAARSLTGADGATFVLRDGDECFYADEDAIEPLWKGQRFPAERCASGWVMEHRRPLVAPDIYADARIPHDAYRPTFVRSLAMVPIRRLDPLGAIGNYWATRHHPTEQEIELLQALADSTAVAMENVRFFTELHSSRLETLQRLALAAEYRDETTAAHTERVGRTAFLLAGALGLDAEEAAVLRQAAPLHDLGKLAVPDAVLRKRGSLTAAEFEQMKRHATAGAAILAGSSSSVLRAGEQIAASHHERWDGAGYPFGLAGEAIPLPGRIVALADVFDALTHERSYKPAWEVGRAVEEITGLRERQFDPDVVEAFLGLDVPGLIDLPEDWVSDPAALAG